MERIGFLINKLKEQYEKAGSQDSMLVTLQMLYRELMPKMEGNPAIGSVSVVVPGQMDLCYLEKNINQKLALDLTPSINGKQVFELSLEPSQEVKPIEKQLVTEIKPIGTPQVAETKPVEKPIAANVEFPKNPFIVSIPKVEPPVPKPAETIVEKPKEDVIAERKPETANDINSRFMPPELNSTIVSPPIIPEPIAPQPPVQPQPLKPTTPSVPPKEIHETIQTNNQPSLNDNEKRQPELFNVLKAEPLKDLKKAISINDRFQYINHLFMKDETMYERSLKTINSFNVLSEAQFWIRKELATKMGWNDDDELVQQFMHLVERRFA